MEEVNRKSPMKDQVGMKRRCCLISTERHQLITALRGASP